MTLLRIMTLSVLSAGALVACADPVVTPSVPSALTVVHGVQEISVPGQRLDTILVRLTDAQGQGVPGWRVEWSGDGTVVPVDTVTDVLGFASAVWTLPRFADLDHYGPAGPSGSYSLSSTASAFGAVTLATTARAFTADRVEAAERIGCALRAGELWCWGAGLFLEKSSFAPRRLPIPGGITISDLVVGDDIICVADQNGGPWCSSRRSPDGFTRVAGAPALTDLIVIGSIWENGSVCGLTVASGQVWCWPQFDAHTLPAISLAPIGFTAIDGGRGFGCGLAQDGTPWCWQQARIAGGILSGPLPPISVPGSPPLVSITVGQALACGATGSGEVWCWDLRQVPDSTAVPIRPDADWIRGTDIMVGAYDEITVPTPSGLRIWARGEENSISASFSGYGITQFSGFGSICFRAASSEIFCSRLLIVSVSNHNFVPERPIPVADPRSDYSPYNF